MLYRLWRYHDMGSGHTTQRILEQLREISADQYRRVLSPHIRARKQLDLAVDAFRDGMTTLARHLEEMGAITVDDDSTDQT